MSDIEIEVRGDVVISHWPEHPTAEMVHAFFDEVERLLAVRPRAVILEALQVKSSPISVRNAAGRRLRVMEPLFKRSLRGQATVVGSPLVRGALATIHFFAPPRYPARTFSSLEEALVWSEDQLASGRSGEHRSVL